MPHAARLTTLFLILLLTAATSQAALPEASSKQKSNKPLSLGFYPYYSTEMLRYRLMPLAWFAQEMAGRPVKLKAATSFESFLEQAVEQSYDLALAPAHFAALLTRDHHYLPALIIDVNFSAIIISQAKSTIKNPEDLKGKTLAVPSPLALVTRITLQGLQEKGINTEKNLTIVKKSTHDRALHAVLNGQTDAAIISTTIIDALPTSTVEKLHVVDFHGNLPGDVILVRQELLNQLKLSPTAFGEAFLESRYAKTFAIRWIFNINLKTLEAADLEVMLPYAPELPAPKEE